MRKLYEKENQQKNSKDVICVKCESLLYPLRTTVIELEDWLSMKQENFEQKPSLSNIKTYPTFLAMAILWYAILEETYKLG